MVKYLFLAFFLAFFTLACTGPRSKTLVQVEGKSKVLSSWANNLDIDSESGSLAIGLNAPFAEGGKVFIGSPDGFMRTLELETGKLVWKTDDQYSFDSAPTSFGDSIIYGNKAGRVFSRHKVTGKLNYSLELGSAVETAPVILDDKAFLVTRNHMVYCLDNLTGKILWSYKRTVPMKTTLQGVSRPVIEGNRLYIGFADGQVAALAVQDGNLLWETRISFAGKFADIDLNPMIKGSRLYIGPIGGPLHVLDKANGNLIRTIDYPISAGPIYLDKLEQIILGTTDGKIIKLDKYDEIVQELKVTNMPLSALSIWEEKAIFGTLGGLVGVVAVSDLKPLFTQELGSSDSAIFSPISVDQGTFVVYSSRNRIYAFKFL